MHNKHTHTRRLMVPATALIALLACLGLAACGGSSSTSTTNAANTSTTAHGSAGRFAAMRECLQRNGITLPQRTPGQGGPGGGPGGAGGGPGGAGGGPGGAGGPGGPGFLGGERKLPNGVTREQFQAAIKKCGGGTGRFLGGAGRFSSPAYRNALTAYATCMSSNGIKLPTPNTSGKGPVFNTTSINTSSAQFKAAAAKCQSVLRNVFGHYRRVSPGAAGGA
jgi:hypothetical protein